MKASGSIDLGNGRQAKAVYAAPDDSPNQVLAKLGIPHSRGLLLVIGGTAEPDPNIAGELSKQFAIGVAGTALEDGLTIVSGGTDAGVLALLGRGFEGHFPTAAVVGVAPLGRVTWPGRTHPSGNDLVALEPHHTHFVLVHGAQWGEETPLLLGLVNELARRTPAVVLLASGGSIAKRELLGLVEAGRHVIVLGGSGRLADEVAWAQDADGSPNSDLADALATGQIEVLPSGSPPIELATRIRRCLGPARGEKS